MTWEIRQGDALERLREMPDESVHCCITSPPYWGLRDYGVDGQMGLEETPEQFIASMVEVFAEVRRVLRADGTLWVNIGDSYAGSWAGNSMRPEGGKQREGNPGFQPLDDRVPARNGTIPTGCKPKDLIGIPWTLAFALRADGWYLRRDIIWAKPNPMPESVQDRPTSAHEYLFLLSKSRQYFYDAEAIREPATYAGPNGRQLSPYAQGFARRTAEEEEERQDKQRGHGRRHAGFNERWDSMSKEEQQSLGRNKRSVWTIATRPFPDAHFATFPPDLVKPCILAATSPKYCAICGMPWLRLTDTSYENPGNRPTNGPRSVERKHETAGYAKRLEKRVTTLDWQPTCDHAEGGSVARVLDPFAGAATSGLVASQLGRDFVGIELNPEYVEMGRDRIRRWEANPAETLTGPPEVSEAQFELEIT